MQEDMVFVLSAINSIDSSGTTCNSSQSQNAMAAMDTRKSRESCDRGADYLQILRRADARGLLLLQDLISALQRRDAAVPNEKYRIAAEDLEPIFEILHEVLQECKVAVSDLHQKARDAMSHMSGSFDGDIFELFKAADRAEQDLQLKTQLIDSLYLASTVQQVTAVQVMWTCQPYLSNDFDAHIEETAQSMQNAA